MLRRKDFLWLLAYPLYQTLGTLRHEGGHAIVAVLQGAKVTEFVFWPSVGEYGFYWGYVRYTGTTDWLFLAAPYLLDVLTYCAFFCICMWVRFRKKWIWLNLVIIGMVSPFVNSLFNYWGSEGSSNDVGGLFDVFPREYIHGFFIFALVAYALGLVLIFLISKNARAVKSSRPMTGDDDAARV